MKRSRANKAKSSPGQGKTSSSPTKECAVVTRSRKVSGKRNPDETPNNRGDDDSVTNQPQENETKSTAVVGAAASQDEERASSPDPNCSICLCKMEDKSFTHSCFHMFCFTCLLEWSKIKAECPLCKQSFTSIIHNIRSESDYDVHHLRDAVVASPPVVTADDDVRLFPFLFGRSPMRPWTPLLSPIDLQLLADFRTSAHGMTQGFYADEAFHIFQHLEGRSQIYRDERWAREINLPLGLSYRNVSPEYFTASTGSDYWQRIATWLDRELATLSRHNINMRGHVRDYVMHLLQNHDVRSVTFHAEVEPFFGSHTRLFVNQLHNFVRSPLSIRETDHLTVYSDRPPTPPESEVITLDRDDSDIEIVSPAVGGDASRRRRNSKTDWPNGVLDPFFGVPFRPLQVAGAIDSFRVNSPIAGPSGLLGRLPPPTEPEPLTFDVTDLHEVSDSDSSSKSHFDNEIFVVGFDKPWRARSPISLSSDGSDVEVDESCTDTNPSLSNKSSESAVRLQSSSHNGGAENAKALDAEGDVASQPWSEFSGDALSEISSGASVDKALERFLRADSLFAGFERRFLPKKCLETFTESGVDCSQDGACVQCSDGAVSGGCGLGGSIMTDDSFPLKLQSRKRNRDDCGDSGVVVDVEQFCDSEEPLPKRSAYKKHYRGHKKSVRGVLETDVDHTDAARPEEPATVGTCQADVSSGNSSATQVSELLSAANGLIHVASESLMSSSRVRPELGEECRCSRDRTGVERKHKDSSSVSTCDNSTDYDAKSSSVNSFQSSSESAKSSAGSARSSVGSAKSSIESHKTFVETTQSSVQCAQSSAGSTTAENGLSSDSSNDSTMGSSTRSYPSETFRIRDDLDVSLHSIESINSDDSVQWLDLERPASPSATANPIPQRNRHISIASNESFLFSPSVNSVVLQLSDDDDDDDVVEEKDHHSFNAVLSDVSVIAATKRSPQRLNLVSVEAGSGSSSCHSGDDQRVVVNGVKPLSEFLRDACDDSDSTVSDNGVVILSQLTESESGATYEQVNGVESLPESSEGALEHDSNVSKSESTSNSEEKLVNGVEGHSESSENALECELGDDGVILESGNLSDVVPGCDGTAVDGITRLVGEDIHPEVHSPPLTLYLDEFRTKTSSSCGTVDEAFDGAITEAAELDNGCKKTRSNGLLPIDESC